MTFYYVSHSGSGACVPFSDRAVAMHANFVGLAYEVALKKKIGRIQEAINDCFSDRCMQGVEHFANLNVIPFS